MPQNWYSHELDTKFLSLLLVIKLEKAIAKKNLKTTSCLNRCFGFFITENQAHFSFLLTIGISQMFYISFFLLVERSMEKQRGELGYIPDQNGGGYVANWLCKQCPKEHLCPPDSQSAEFLKHSDHKELQMKVQMHLAIRFLTKFLKKNSFRYQFFPPVPSK